MQAIDLIAKHFEGVKVPTEKRDAVCAFTGKRITEGVPKKIAIKKTFTDTQYLRYPSEFISKEVYACMSRIKYNGNDKFELRKYSFLATESYLHLLQRADIIPILLNPPEPPFVLSFTASNKKHRAFKAEVAVSKTEFPVALDGLNCPVKVDTVKEIVSVMQKWYAILPGKEDTEQQPTWFNKNEIRDGSTNMKKIAEYGINKYFQENETLERYRNAPFYEMLVLCTKKGVIYVHD